MGYALIIVLALIGIGTLFITPWVGFRIFIRGAIIAGIVTGWLASW